MAFSGAFSRAPSPSPAVELPELHKGFSSWIISLVVTICVVLFGAAIIVVINHYSKKRFLGMPVFAFATPGRIAPVPEHDMSGPVEE